MPSPHVTLHSVQFDKFEISTNNKKKTFKYINDKMPYAAHIRLQLAEKTVLKYNYDNQPLWRLETRVVSREIFCKQSWKVRTNFLPDYICECILYLYKHRL